MAKQGFLALFIFIFSALASAQTAIISDLDETIKRTGSKPGRVLMNILFTQKIYAGMDELFREMALYTDDLFIVTAQPKLSRFNIEKLIRKNGLVVKDIYTRNFLEDSFEYKVASIKDVLSKGYKKVVLIGDDTSKDPKVYAEIKKLFPDKVLSIYIHKVKDKEVPNFIRPYFTVYEIALNEVLEGRMEAAQAYSLGESFLEKNLSKVFPEFVMCPKAISAAQFPYVEELKELTRRVKDKIVQYCRKAPLID